MILLFGVKNRGDLSLKEYARKKCKTCNKVVKCRLITRTYNNNHYSASIDRYSRDKLMEIWCCSSKHTFTKTSKMNGSDLGNHPVWDSNRRALSYRVNPTKEDVDNCKK